jgi:hypothetical protein
MSQRNRNKTISKKKRKNEGWGKVCRPLELGGIGISSLKELGWALRMRWLWLEKRILVVHGQHHPFRFPINLAPFL